MRENDTIIAKLVSKAPAVSLSFLRFSESYRGCLKRVQELTIEDEETIESLQMMLFGEAESGCSVSTPHPLRVLHYQRFNILVFSSILNGINFPYLREISCHGLTLVDFRSLTSLRRLTMVQPVLRCLAALFKYYPVTRFASDFETSVGFINQLKSLLPPQMATDLSGVFCADPNSLTFPMSALPFLIAGSTSDVDRALNEFHLSDAQATLYALAALHLDERFFLECSLDEDVASTPAGIDFQRYKIKKLLELGADLFAPVRALQRHQPVHTTVFHIAVSCGCPSFVSALYSCVSVTDVDRIRDQYGFTPLHYPSISSNAWKECFDWHHSNVPNWQLTDALNLYDATPVSWLLTEFEDGDANLVHLLDHFARKLPSVVISQLDIVSLGRLIKYLSIRWCGMNRRSGSTNVETLAQVIENRCHEASELVSVVDLEVLVFLLHTCPGVFRRVIKGVPAALLADAFAFDVSSFPSIVDHFFDALRHNGMETIPLVTSSGRSLMDCCAIDSKEVILAKILIDYSVNPLCSTEDLNRDVIKRVTRYLGAGDPPRNSALVAAYFHHCRPDLAALVIESSIANMFPNSSAISALQCPALFADEGFVQFLHDPVLQLDGNATRDLTTTVLFILLSPIELTPLPADLHASLIKHLVSRLVENSSSYFSTVLENLIFIPAFLTLFCCDAQRYELVMSVLPQLVQLFQHGSVNPSTISAFDIRCFQTLHGVKHPNKEAAALFQQFSFAISNLVPDMLKGR